MKNINRDLNIEDINSITPIGFGLTGIIMPIKAKLK